MTDNPLHHTFTEAMLLLLDATFEQSKGIYLDRNTSIFETLTTISAEEASRPVSAKCASIAAHVAHLNFYMDVTLRFVRGERPQVDWSEIWNTVQAVTPEEWQASQKKLRETYGQIIELVKSTESWEGENVMAGALGVLAHNAYHLGEIRQALCTIKNDR